ncbi:MAG: NAD(P)-dependent oxidoreductase [Patescibacteria group bacterium]|nr:NAD(P)-dependent oxidoreductase [Patescibacteria group bacterium]
MQKDLILGSNGMLGQELVRVFNNDEGYEVIAWDRDDIDVRDKMQLSEKIMDIMPDIIFNAVAYNAVDACEESEEEYAKAKMLNATFPRELAKISKNVGATVVHYSTDYVFDGKRPVHKGGKRNPNCCGQGCEDCMYMGPEEKLGFFAYHENDEAHPVSKYGRTKLMGEENVQKVGGDYYIIRLSKLFGLPAESADGKKSFFDVMLELGKKNDSVQAVDGETSKFTYAPDLAKMSKGIVEKKMDNGIYHVANEGAVTWYDGVVELYKIAGLNTEVKSVTSETFPRPAERPNSSVLKMTKIVPLRHYSEALAEYINNK